MHFASPVSSAAGGAPGLAHRLRKLSWLVRLLILAGTALALWQPACMAWGEPALVSRVLGDSCGDLARLLVGEVTPRIRLRLVAVSLPGTLLALAALWQLWRLFSHYGQGRVFGRAALAHLQRFGWLMVALALTGPLSHGLRSVALTLDNPPGQRHLVLSYSSNDYVLLLLALVFVAIARVMNEAVRVAEEHEQFV
jgi:Protein of unknown function (DUF2975)